MHQDNPETITIELLNDVNSPFLKEINKLADLNSKTLGFNPYPFYEKHVKAPGILIAVSSSNELTGYLIWSVNKLKNQARLWQLCIKDKFRGQKITHLLNTELVNQVQGLRI